MLVREDHRLPLVGMGVVFRGGCSLKIQRTWRYACDGEGAVKGTKKRTAEQIANESNP